MSKNAIIFDGQGSKFNKFGLDFYNEEPSFRKTIDENKESFDIVKEIYEKEDNPPTQVYQPGCFLVETAISRLLKEAGISIDCVAGASLGEYSALWYDNVIDTKAGLELLKYRGKLMKDCLSQYDSKMCAIMFLDNKIVEKICENNNCDVSNDNSYGNVVISGLGENVLSACKECEKAGAKRIIELKTDGAYHSRLLNEIEPEFKQILMRYIIDSTHSSKVYFNYTGSKESGSIIDLLNKQLSSKVKFLQIIENMLNDGVDTFYEIGSNGDMAFHIKNIAKENNKDIKVIKICNYEDYKGAL